MALLPPQFLDAVVALGRSEPNGLTQISATGFLCGYPVGVSNGEEQYRLFLVTNRHVVEGKDVLQARLNRPIGSDSKVYNVILKDSDGSPNWTVHPDPNCDVAVIAVSVPQLKKDRIDYTFFPVTPMYSLSLEQAKESQVSEGDGVFVLGFPLGQAGEDRNYVIVRYGVIARIRDWLGGNSRTILIDASVFPGNSGGPVVIRPEVAAIEGTNSNSKAILIGMVSGYLPYEDIAVSQQTGRSRITFQENSGLAIVVPIDVIHETLRLAVTGSTTPQQDGETVGNDSRTGA